MLRTRMRRSGPDEGATAVEFALVLPALLTVIFFALYGAMFFYYGAVADHVARTVARQVSIPMGKTGTAYPDSSPSLVTADAAKTAGSLIPAPSQVTTTSKPVTATPQEGDLVTVTVTYHLPVLTQLASLIPGMSAIDTVSRSATQRRQ